MLVKKCGKSYSDDLIVFSNNRFKEFISNICKDELNTYKTTDLDTSEVRATAFPSKVMINRMNFIYRMNKNKVHTQTPTVAKFFDMFGFASRKLQTQNVLKKKCK